MKVVKKIGLVLILIIFTSCSRIDVESDIPIFKNVEVHDPSVVKDGDTYYVFGSHLASAKSKDMIQWEQISTRPRANNPLFPDVDTTLNDTLTFAETETLWAPDVIMLKNGKYAFYYNACEGTRPQSAMGLALSNNIEGPYEDKGIFLKSGQVLGGTYDANVDPNVVDPNVFYDESGDLYMVYGSYSGGIFILSMDKNTGFPLEGQAYGQKILGGYHARIEGPYILYSKETDYYYLFLSYGGLDVKGGYNIRVARSKSPKGPYYDSAGNNMLEAMGKPGEIFHDPSYEPYGHKLIGNFLFSPYEGNESLIDYAYVSPGHNSAYYDEELNQYFLLFHTRFPKTGDAHQVRVHQFFFNEEGWPVIAPIRYGGEKLMPIDKDELKGDYRLVNHGHDITSKIKKSEVVRFESSGTVSGAYNGTWAVEEDCTLYLEIENEVYSGYVLRQYDIFANKWVYTFTLGSENGHSIWAIE